MKKIVVAILLSAIALSPFRAAGEELACKVEINADQVEGSSKQVFQTLEAAINEYMNNTRWSNAQFAVNEKIECRLFFTFKTYIDGVMKGDLQIQSTRPVYNSSYTTTLINFKDTKIEFAYTENDPLRFSETTMESQLTAILNFYAYMILAIDFDSFSLYGGDFFYDKASNVVQMAQSSGEVGWKAFEDTKNRSAVLNAFTEPATKGFRDMIYQYHRNGLDEMALSPDKGRAAITASLDYLPKIHDVAPMSVGLSIFKDSKLDELVNVYSKATQSERDKAYDILQPIYPSESDRITKIKTSSEK
ncbi:MAG: DUF4835 family protein [Muribaculaceae bacterium]|nr:DUF4835 family protein [Muribaculaceae bacterium]